MNSGELYPVGDGAVVLELVPGAGSDIALRPPPSAGAMTAHEVNHRIADAAMNGDSDWWLRIAYWLILFPTLFALMAWALSEGGSPLWLLAPLPLWTAARLYRRSRMDQTNILRAIPQFDTSWIGPLIDATLWPDTGARTIVRAKLLQLMPHVTGADATRLTESQRRTFHELLETRGDYELRVALLQGAAELGNAETVHIVENLSSGRAYTRSSRAVRHAARLCLPKLKARLRELEPVDNAVSLSPAVSSETQELSNIATPEQILAEQRLQETIASFEQHGRTRSAGMRMGFLIADWALIVPYCGWHAVTLFLQGRVSAGLLFSAFTAVGSQLHRFSITSGQAARARLLAEFDKLECVGPLTFMLEAPVEENKQIAIDALIKLLPKLKISDSSLLNDPQRTCLYRALRQSYAHEHPELVIAILAALEQVGDERAIEPVKRLATEDPLTGKPEKVRQAAHECLLYLPERAMATRHSQQLLRASGQEESGASILLRPVRESDTTNQAQLLRPGNGSS